ncbi:tubulin-specific chaperone A isoform X2 [Apus apus]|uniref:tubulin-specific chaperone A isoform X2 n=1 Tax=Apus apus TaxID=8895 RepID=UPI0021F836BE|nr:tubulin-specific chaperone A isoform X2 [Apus apus]
MRGAGCAVPALRPPLPRPPQPLGPGRAARHGRPAPEADQDQDRRRQAIEILQESRMMIPDCQRRLEVAHADLTQLLENEKELEEAEEYKEARSILESVKLEA